jgi:subtilisin family serine protease
MKRSLFIMLPLLLLGIGAAVLAPWSRAGAQAGRLDTRRMQAGRNERPAATVRADYVEGELLVKFAAGPKTARLARNINEQVGARVIKDFPLTGWQHVRLPSGLSSSAALSFYKSMPGVVAAQPNYIYRETATPDDTFFFDQYGMVKIQAPAAWDTNTGSDAVVVAVIDTGIYYPHEDLNANMWRNAGEMGQDANGNDKATNGIDDDADGYVDDVYGIDSVNHDSNPIDDRGHGTHCAGIVGAAGNNGKGVAGVNWNVRLMALKFISQAGEGTTAGAVECFSYVVMMKQRGVNVRVTNNSYGGDDDFALKDAMDTAGDAGILNVCAAGNSASNIDVNPFYPASFVSPSIITVAASDRDDNPASFTNYGPTSVDLAAPGVTVISTVSDGPMYAYLSGTSMSAPHVAGAAALLLAQYPNSSVGLLKATLINTVDVLPQWSGKVASGGRLNVARALQSLNARAIISGQVRDPNGGRLAGVNVQLQSQQINLLQSVQTDEKGFYQFTDLVQGYDYTLQPSLDGYSLAPASQNINDLSGDQTADFTATPLNCTYSLSAASQHFSANAGSGFFNVTANQGCSWRVRISDSWIDSYSTEGDGNATVTYYVEVNPAHTARNGNISVGGQTFNITQDAAPESCQYTVTPSQTSFGPAGGQANVQVNVANGCEWRARSNDFWITITSGSGDRGNGVVSFTVGGNGGPAKTGSMTIAGQTVTIEQQGASEGFGQAAMLSEMNTMQSAGLFLSQPYQRLIH